MNIAPIATDSAKKTKDMSTIWLKAVNIALAMYMYYNTNLTYRLNNHR
jgi:hypothetical protein